MRDCTKSWPRDIFQRKTHERQIPPVHSWEKVMFDMMATVQMKEFKKAVMNLQKQGLENEDILKFAQSKIKSEKAKKERSRTPKNTQERKKTLRNAKKQIRGDFFALVCNWIDWDRIRIEVNMILSK